MGDLGVDTEGVRSSTAVAPADDSHQRQGVVLGRISSHQGAAAVTLAGVLTSSHEAGTEHVLRHLGGHGAAVSVSEHRHPGLGPDWSP